MVEWLSMRLVLSTREKDSVTPETNQQPSHSEALSFAIDVAQSQVHVGPDALHGLGGQRAAQVLGVGPGRR